MKRKNQKIGLAAAAFFLAAGVCVSPAMAYFTTSVSASGGHELQLNFTTTVPEEKVSEWKKQLTVKNTGIEDCYVRVTAFAGEGIELTWTADGNWADGKDGYWYYKSPLAPESEGAEASGISVEIEKGNREDAFNVIVVQECAPVLYGADGTLLGWEDVDWSGKADVVRTESGEDE